MATVNTQFKKGHVPANKREKKVENKELPNKKITI